jgi:hypothetical protein
MLVSFAPPQCGRERRKRSGSRERRKHRSRSGSRSRSSRHHRNSGSGDERSSRRESKRSRHSGEATSGSPPPGPALEASQSASSFEEKPVLPTPLAVPEPRPVMMAVDSAPPSMPEFKLQFSTKSGKGQKRADPNGGGSALFRADDDEDSKRDRPLITIDYTEDDRAKTQAKSMGGRLTERQQAMVEQIPRDKEQLWTHPIDWAVVDKNDIVDGKIRAWVVKKIKEYLGEEEQTLINFITTKLKHHCSPKELLKELSVVLEDETEVFVQKLWRILIYYCIECDSA